ncbi:MAG TPA: hypothetical protein VF041_02595 [Gemmatimonadaceae bacterium]
MENATPSLSPALTPEQWRDRDYRQQAAEIDSWAKRTADREATDDATEYVAKLGLTAGGDCVIVMSRAHDKVLVPPPARHALAALALHEQPYGFTSTDLAGLRRAAEWAASSARAAGESGAAREAAAVIQRVAARVGALLPPGDT